MREGVAILFELVLGEQILLEAAIQGDPWGQPGQAVIPQQGRGGPGRRAGGQAWRGWGGNAATGAIAEPPSGPAGPLEGPGSPFRSSTRGLLGRLSEKLVLVANLPPSTISWDTTLRPPVSGSGGRVQYAQTPGCTPALRGGLSPGRLLSTQSGEA